MRHRFSYGLSERLRWSRGTFHEKPALELPTLAPEQAERIAALQCRYQVKFEVEFTAATSANNYEYLDILDRGWRRCGLPQPVCGVLCDIGCANFWYAPALQVFFRPERLQGIEIEGYRLYRNGRTRIDYARGYLAGLPGASFVVADYARCSEPADVITAWFPFLTANAVLAWRLPLSMLAPAALFARIRRNLRAGGFFIMVNYGTTEAALAAAACDATGLQCIGRDERRGLLSAHRLAPAIFSCWTPRGRSTPTSGRT